MIKTSLYNLCTSADFEKIFKEKGYAYFTKGYYNLNIIGIRAGGLNVTNKFDDYIVVIYDTKNGTHRRIYNVTTDPGKHYIKQPINPNGAALLVPNQYRGAWKIGKHKGKYDALVQVKPVKVYRDRNRNDVYDLDPNTIEEGNFGLNIHRSNPYTESTYVDKWSAGCQVFANASQFKSFIELCRKQRDNFGNSFTYTLLNEKDLL